MPSRNQFRHQSYPTQPRITPTRHVISAESQNADYRHLQTQHGIRQIVLVPGTFAGDDPFAVSQILRALADRLPAGGQIVDTLAERIAARTTQIIHAVAQDVGTYSDEFQKRFSELVDGQSEVVRLEPTWSGQNHHFARADLAMRLLYHLDRMELSRREQVLFWGHSHAGNGFAILSNLLANHRPAVDRLFEACEPLETDHWQQAREILAAGSTPHRLAHHVSLVTFGTPVRYGWDTNGYRQLYHVLFDRGTPADSFTTQPMFPPYAFRDILDASWGDWVQAFGIAGTDVVPPTPQTIARNGLLSDVLEAGLEPPEAGIDTRLIPGDRLRMLCGRWKTGTRCHADGHNLLVDYQPCGRMLLGRPVESSIFGHGVATTVDWLPAHLALILKRMAIGRTQRPLS